ncbi:Disease resistance protein [Melia azedarach]|uniref:Disease resistance protein n=1 Tax=Melia azedarach TaxID=155640 RepID=A0ACC1YKF9_MELAZ|nr:Disease resistance protein [Melia azedarach]
MAVGELLLSAFFQVLFDRLSNPELLNFVTQQGVRSKLRKWEKKLKIIQAVLGDAEEKQLTDEAVKIWLEDLRDLAYDAEDIVERFATQALERKMMAEHQATDRKVQNLIPGFFTSFSPSSFKFNVSMRSKIKDIHRRLEELCKQRIELGLEIDPGRISTASQQRPPSTSVPTERAVYGRDEDKAKILEMVLSDTPNDSNFRVIPIVGMAGVGKTTLARVVYNDKAVEDFMFDIKAWVCVSDDFDVLSISKALLESINCRACDLKTLNEVLVQLKMAVDGKKFLLVLDDVWNEDYSLWETLKSPFMGSAPKSKIIVTTRHAHVASTMGPVEHYNLQLLSDEDCWSVFMKHVFESTDHSHAHQISQSFRKKVIEKCAGLPLAASTLGGLLRSRRYGAWEDVLNNKIWDSPQQSGILPVLRLSYHYLPSYLKRCFAYCAILPKDYEFEERELVFLWMAEGMIQQSRNNKQLEDSGSEYFHELVSRSIFQHSGNDTSKFIMHDLVHDLAQFIFGGTSLRLEDVDKNLRRFERARHFSYNRSHFDGKSIMFPYDVKHLRTFLPMPFCSSNSSPNHYMTSMVLHDLLIKFVNMRVLSLQGYYITVLPNSVGDLRLLRYLNLAGTMIRSLPKSTSSLFNLQILILRSCSRLMKLPSNMRNLINLRHLDITGVNLREMPLGMKELKNIQTLTNFIVGKGIGSGLQDLKDLQFLSGELCISGLENVTDLEDIREVIVRDKKGLQALSFQWRSQADNSGNEIVEENVLGMLQPHTNIKKLTITCYSGKRFPLWIGDPSLSNIVTLELINCKNCTSLPTLGMLGSLKHLNIEGMTGIKRIGFEIYGDCSKPFQSLETLRCEYLAEWEHWDTVKENEHVEIFPSLLELSIVECPNLSEKLPDHLPLLETLVISECPKLAVSFSSFPMLCKLEVNGCKELVCSTPIDSQAIKSMTITNSSLDIYGSKGMVYNSPTDSKSLLKFVHISNFLEFGKLLKRRFQEVEYLAIGDFSLLISSRRYSGIFPYEKPAQGLHMVTYPEEVSIEENCVSLISFPEINVLSNNLRSLKIENSRDLKCLPLGMMKNIAQLESLYIKSCHSLTFIVRGKLPSSLKRLEIWSCKKLQRLLGDENDVCASSSTSSSSSSSCSSSMTLEHLEIWYCSELVTLSSRSQLLETLESLYIRDCPKLESVAESFHGNANLKEMGFVNCKSLKSIPEGLHNLNSLQQISLGNCPSLVCFPERGLPSTISSVAIDKCDKLRALPNNMHKLNALRHLEIRQCPGILCLPLEGFPINLTSLKIEDTKLYKALMLWGLHRLNSLKRLWIHGCHEAESFPDDEIGVMLPSSLNQLFLFGFLKLKKLSSVGFQSLSTLEVLWIYNCPKLTSFPEQGLPPSLLRLYIWNCPLLKRHCKRDKGKEWYKLTHIPCVEIDRKFIYDPEEEE